jgi:hypothetical protein
MARMVFGTVANESAPARPCHLRAPGGKTLCGRRITRGVDAWSSPKMVTCKHCRHELAKGAR